MQRFRQGRHFAYVFWLIAVGLLYRSGYFRQSLTADGWQHESYPSLDPQGLPLRLLTDKDNVAANALYASRGGVAQEVVEWDFNYADD